MADLKPSAPPLPLYSPLLSNQQITPSPDFPHPHLSRGYILDPHPPPPPPLPYPILAHPNPNHVVFGFPVLPPLPPRWSTGLCSCCADPSVCLLGCFCPCILFGQIAESLDDGMTSSLAACTIWYILQQFTAMGWIYSCGYRTKLQSRYGLPPRYCRNCIIHFCCWHCAFCQEYRELKIRREAASRRPSVMVPPAPQAMSF